MNTSNSNTEDETISVKDLQNALNEETHDVKRAADLRIRELTKLSSDYAAGALSPAEATNKYMRFLNKWGDPFPGLVKTATNLSDEQIHEEMEKSLDGHVARISPIKSPRLR